MLALGGEPVVGLGPLWIPGGLQEQAQVVGGLGMASASGVLPAADRLLLLAHLVGQEAQIVGGGDVAVGGGPAVPLAREGQLARVLADQRQPPGGRPGPRVGGALEPPAGRLDVAALLQEQGREVDRGLRVAGARRQFVPADGLLQRAVLLVPDAQVVGAVDVAARRGPLPPVPGGRTVAALGVELAQPVRGLGVAVLGGDEKLRLVS